jgi:hypothetical protein
LRSTSKIPHRGYEAVKKSRGFSIVFSVVVAFGFGFAFLSWLPALIIAIAAFAVIVAIIR